MKTTEATGRKAVRIIQEVPGIYKAFEGTFGAADCLEIAQAETLTELCDKLKKRFDLERLPADDDEIADRKWWTMAVRRVVRR